MVFCMSSCNSSSPSGAFKSYMELIKKGDTKEFAKSIAVFETGNPEDLEQQYQLIEDHIGEIMEKMQDIEDVQILEETISEDGYSATMKVKFIYGDGTEEESTMDMVRQDGKWKIDLFLGGNIGDVLQQPAGDMGIQYKESPTEFSQEEQELATSARQVILSNEDIWYEIFKKYNIGKYKAPKIVFYTGSTRTICGHGKAAVGPFYCSGDQKVYLDLSFFQTMDRQIGVKGDKSNLAKTYVIAHEVGHHIENLMGTLDKANRKMQTANQTNANKYKENLELMADFYAGVWAHYEMYFNSISDKDLQEAIDCVQKIGEDYLKKRSKNYSSLESFTHGSSSERMKWFKLGYESGDVRKVPKF